MTGPIRLASVLAAIALIGACSKKKNDADTAKKAPPQQPRGGDEAPTKGGKASKPKKPKIGAHKKGTKKADWGRVKTAAKKAGKTKSNAKVSAAQVSAEGVAAGGQGFRVAYGPAKRASHGMFRDAFKQERVFETIAEALNETFAIKGKIDIHLAECGSANAFYDDRKSRIIMCYELMAHFLELFDAEAEDDDELGQLVIGATFFVFFHELGHALIDKLKLPTTGREEDAVDQLATLILLDMGDEGVDAALSGAFSFQLEQYEDDDAGDPTPLWDEHSMSGQRFYNVLCLVYGSNPDKYDGFVEDETLPEERAGLCQQDYERTDRAWATLVEPHLRDAAKKKRVGGDAKPKEAP